MPRKKVKCPNCGFPLMDTAPDIKLLVVLAPMKKGTPDYCIKCRHCGKEVVIKHLDS